MKIAVIGAGNVGTLVAGEFTKKGHQVTLYTRDKSKWSDVITVYDRDTDTSYTYSISKITENIEEAVKDADMIFITMPPHAIKPLLEKTIKHIKNGTIIGFYPGTGGMEFICKSLIDKDCIIFGTQRICSVVRLKEYGKYVVTSGKRKDIYLGTIPSSKAKEMSKLFAELFDIATHPLPNYLSVTLTPSNPILHPSRLYSIFKDYENGKEYRCIPKLYEEWTDMASKTLIACDNELHNILKKISLDTTQIRPLLEHYESINYQEMTNKIHSIKSFKGIDTPSVYTGKGYIPDFESRYFMADIPYGLIIIKSFAMICNVKTRNIDKIIRWYQNITNKNYIDLENNTLGKDAQGLTIPQLYGIKTIKEIEDFYR